MRRFHAFASAALASALLLAADPATGPVQEADYRWSGRIDDGRAVEIKNVNGDVRARATSGSEVVVRAEKDPGRDGDPGDITFDVVEHAGGVTICAVYPSPAGRRPNECAPGRSGRMNTDDDDTSVRFTVEVPRGVVFVGRTVNGDVEGRDLGSDAEGHTVNGDVVLVTEGTVRSAGTVNGSVEARMGRAEWREGAEFSTVNGSITLELPDGLGADVGIRTTNGSIETDFPLTVRGRWGPKRARGTIGGGGPDLELETVNGSIRLRRR